MIIELTGEIRATTFLDQAADVGADIVRGPRLPEIAVSQQDLPLQAVGVACKIAGGHGQIRFCRGVVSSGQFQFHACSREVRGVVQSSM